jgi:translation initiation factor 4G
VGKCRSEFELMGKEPERENMGDLSAEDKEHKLKKLRQRTLGNVEFIGELFKKKMVGLGELEELLNKLLDSSPEDHDTIHPLCKLLESVGKALEAASKEKLDGYFARIQELAGHAGLSSRYKFMLLDLQDLRSKDWVPR